MTDAFFIKVRIKIRIFLGWSLILNILIGKKLNKKYKLIIICKIFITTPSSVHGMDDVYCNFKEMLILFNIYKITIQSPPLITIHSVHIFQD